MLFNSLHFLFFFPLVLALYFIIPKSWRWLWLLVASCYFYWSFIPKYLLILFLLIAIDYTSARLIEKNSGKNKKVFFWISILANIGILFSFKYFNFFNENIQALAQTIHWNYPIQNLAIILPIGLSFHTFQSLAYVIEVYKGKYPAEHHLGRYALYVLFFPQLVAGPIERPQNLLPQLNQPSDFSRDRLFSGLHLMALGFFKKIVVADRLGAFVDQAFLHISDHTSLTLAITVIFYAFQIYCDFSGYTDIAIGAAQTMGFNLMKNFDRPYFSKSISEFWKRWHISLSSWFRDYVYIPLGGNRVPAHRRAINILIVFLLSGLWHGAAWTFIIWGGLHGFYLIFGNITKVWRQKLATLVTLDKKPWLLNSLQQIITFSLVCLSWVWFRASTVSEAKLFFYQLFTNLRLPTFDEFFLGYQPREFYLGIVSIILLLFFEINQEYNYNPINLLNRSVTVRAFTYTFIILLLVVFGVFQSRGFIYFQF